MLALNEHRDIDYNSMYKLHHGEYNRWRKACPWLVDADFGVVDSSESPLYRLFAESSAQVGVGSMAVYEGPVFDLETFVYDAPGPPRLEPLIEDGTVEIITSADELAERSVAVRLVSSASDSSGPMQPSGWGMCWSRYSARGVQRPS